MDRQVIFFLWNHCNYEKIQTAGDVSLIIVKYAIFFIKKQNKYL